MEKNIILNIYEILIKWQKNNNNLIMELILTPHLPEIQRGNSQWFTGFRIFRERNNNNNNNYYYYLFIIIISYTGRLRWWPFFFLYPKNIILNL